LIVELIDTENWSSMQADTKGDIYEGLLEKSAKESPKGAGQYFTPRELIKAIVDAPAQLSDETVCDPACGTGGFLLAAIDFVIKHYDMDKDQKRKGKIPAASALPLTRGLLAAGNWFPIRLAFA
jgi:type I restriction enzyme M protein